MYIPDLSSYPAQWGELENEMNLIAVGWLDREFPYTKGDVSLDFKKKLEIFCVKAMIRDFGVEMCTLCENNEFVNIVVETGKKVQLFGTYEIRIPSKNRNKIYAAPDFIIHYVTVHTYKPPQEFIDAVLSAPLPGTPEFEKFAEPWSKYH